MALTAHRHCAFEIAAFGFLIDGHKLQFDISQLWNTSCSWPLTQKVAPLPKWLVSVHFRQADKISHRHFISVCNLQIPCKYNFIFLYVIGFFVLKELLSFGEMKWKMSDLTFATDLRFGLGFFSCTLAQQTCFMHLQMGIILNLYTHLELWKKVEVKVGYPYRG